MGATSLMFEGIPTYPHAGRFWEIVEKHGVNQFYTAPTAIRALMKQGEEWVKKFDRSTLRMLGTVGEPINPEAWMWYYNVVGDAKVPDRGHLLADRDRRPHDHQPARLDADEAGLGHVPVLRDPHRGRQRGRIADAAGLGRSALHHLPVAGHAARHVGRSRRTS